MIPVSYDQGDSHPGFVNITIDGWGTSLTIDDLMWVRDMCIQPAIELLEEGQ